MPPTAPLLQPTAPLLQPTAHRAHSSANTSTPDPAPLTLLILKGLGTMLRPPHTPDAPPHTPHTHASSAR